MQRFFASLFILLLAFSTANATDRGQKDVVEEGSVTFTAVVKYIQPSYTELKQAFDHVDNHFSYAKLEPIERCRKISREQREVVFEYIHFGREISPDDALEEMDRRGFRPALYEELLAFAKQYPNEHRKFEIEALGSFGLDRFGFRSSPSLYHPHFRERSLTLGLGFGWLTNQVLGDSRLLVVRKEFFLLTS